MLPAKGKDSDTLEDSRVVANIAHLSAVIPDFAARQQVARHKSCTWSDEKNAAPTSSPVREQEVMQSLHALTPAQIACWMPLGLPLSGECSSSASRFVHELEERLSAQQKSAEEVGDWQHQRGVDYRESAAALKHKAAATVLLSAKKDACVLSGSAALILQVGTPTQTCTVVFVHSSVSAGG